MQKYRIPPIDILGADPKVRWVRRMRAMAERGDHLCRDQADKAGAQAVTAAAALIEGGKTPAAYQQMAALLEEHGLDDQTWRLRNVDATAPIPDGTLDMDGIKQNIHRTAFRHCMKTRPTTVQHQR